MTYRVYSDAMIDEIHASQYGFIFLEPHRDLRGHWDLHSLDARYMRNLDDVVDSYSAVPHLMWPKLRDAADREGYQIVFMEDPSAEMEWMASLDQPCGAKLLSSYPDTDEDGLLPFQRQGVNFSLPLRACLMRWDTGVGKAAASIAWTILRLPQHDVCLHVVKKNNLAGITRKLKQFADIDATLIKGGPAKRDELYEQVARQLAAGEKPIIVTAYESLSNDAEVWTELLVGLKVCITWDEMPSKLRNRDTVLYRSLAGLLYTSVSTSIKKGARVEVPYPRAGYERFEVQHLILTATPIYNSPADLFNTIRLAAPDVLGSVAEFERKYVRGIDPWGNPQWDEHKLPLLGGEIAFMTHSVDKTDPDIAKHFPTPIEETSYVKLLPKQQWLYDILQDQYANMDDEALSVLERKDILGAINVLQMICSMPVSVLHSAKQFESWLEEGGDPDTRRGSEVAYKLREIVDDDSVFDTPSAKLMKLIDRLESHPGKMLVFTRMNDTVLPFLSSALDSLGVEHVQYHGKMTDKRRQDAIDHFRSAESCRVLLTTDAGQDSIDLPEADHVVHYDLPWTGVVKTQRQNRASRLTSEHESIGFESIVCEGTYEQRNEEIIEKKTGYDTAVLRGKIAEVSRVARHDALYMLTGRDEYRQP